MHEPPDSTHDPGEPPRDASPGFSDETYRGFRAIAADYLRRERAGHTLQPTALVNEAFLRLGGASESGFTDRRHFVAAVARTMRNILVDHARARNAAKRGGGSGTPITVRLSADRLADPSPEPTAGDRGLVELVELDEALERLEHLDPRQARVVELRFFGGLTVRESAELLGVSDRTIESDWSVARAWLRRELRGSARGETD